jgi:hypothetical protein
LLVVWVLWLRNEVTTVKIIHQTKNNAKVWRVKGGSARSKISYENAATDIYGKNANCEADTGVNTNKQIRASLEFVKRLTVNEKSYKFSCFC